MGGTKYFLEHGGADDVFAQRNVFVSCPVFGALAIFDVGSRGIPAHQSTLFVEERIVTDEEPAILTVLAARSLFDFKRQAASQRRLALLPPSLENFGMGDSGAQ